MIVARNGRDDFFGSLILAGTVDGQLVYSGRVSSVCMQLLAQAAQPDYSNWPCLISFW